MLLSLLVAVDLIKDLFNQRGSRRPCHASPLSDEVLCDSLKLFPASQTKGARHGHCMPQLSRFLHPTNGMRSWQDAEADSSILQLAGC